MKGRLSAAISLVVILSALAASPLYAQNVYKFDMGPLSGLKTGYTHVDNTTTYTVPQGYGWDTAPRATKDFRGEYWVIFSRLITIFDAMPRADDLTLDSVADGSDMTFRVDVPNGTYDCLVYLGDGSTVLWYMDIVVNGVTVDADIDALTPHTRTAYVPGGTTNDPYIGGIAKRRFTVDVTSGQLAFTFTGGPDLGPLSRYIPEIDATKQMRGEFQHNSVMGIEIHEHQPYPFEKNPSGDLVCNVPTPNPNAIAGMNLFNAGDIQGARAAWEAIPETTNLNKVTKANGLMWLVGHPDLEYQQSELALNEIELTDDSVALLADVVASDPELHSAWDLVDMALDVQQAYVCWAVMRGYGYYGQGGYNYRRAYVLWEQLCQEVLQDPSDVFDPTKLRETPYRYKGMIYCSRIVCGYDPRQVTEAYWTGAEVLEDRVHPDFPDNRYANLFVDRTWDDEWYLYDYEAACPPSAPDWAKYQWMVYNELLDLSEWWVEVRQHPISHEFGGGFSDDVEIAPLFGMLAWVCKGASDVAEYGYKLFVDAIWDSDEIDRDRGFSAKYADAEHVCEPIGYSQPMQVGWAYANPRYIERNFLTMKTVRDFLTGINGSGHRHFKANYFSATQLSGNINQQNDSPICVRGIVGGPWLLWYNNNPAVDQLFQEYADAWLADSYRTDKSKPAGILPSNIGYPTDEMGGMNAPNWYRSNQGDLNKFPKYQHYEYKLQAMRYLRTGDPKYLDPFIAATNLALDWDAAGRPASPTEGSLLWAGQQLATGAGIIELVAELAAAADLTMFDTFLDEFESGYAAFQRNSLDKTPMVDHMMAHHYDNILPRWPFMTTEAMMTDRIAYVGILGVTSYYLGADWAGVVFGFTEFACTYENTTRDFAGLPVKKEPDDLRVLCYLFRTEEREIRIRPWRLQVGGTYLLQAGPDANEDHEIDTVQQSYQFAVENKGDPVAVLLPPREVYLVTMTQISPGQPVPPPKADLGLSAEDDMAVTASTIDITVHNVGNADASDVLVQAWDGYPGKGTLLAEDIIASLVAPNDLEASLATVNFGWTPSGGTRAVFAHIDPDDEIVEITEVNNIDVVWYPEGQTQPLAVALADKTTPVAGQTVSFSHLESRSPVIGRYLVLFEWDFEGDGTYEYSTTDPYRTPTYAYSTSGTYVAKLRVTDDGDPAESDVDTITIDVGLPGLTFKNLAGDTLAKLDNAGNLQVSGELRENSTPRGSGGADFLIKATGGSVAAGIYTNGDVILRGSAYENQTSLVPPVGSFIVKNGSGDVVAYITQDGDLYLAGEAVSVP